MQIMYVRRTGACGAAVLLRNGSRKFGVVRTRGLRRAGGFHAEGSDLLFHTVFEDAEIGLRKAGHVMPISVGHDDRHQHLPYVDFDGVFDTLEQAREARVDGIETGGDAQLLHGAPAVAGPRHGLAQIEMGVGSWEPAPPRHEILQGRPWRHPSEIARSRVDCAPERNRARGGRPPAVRPPPPPPRRWRTARGRVRRARREVRDRGGAPL